MIVSILCGLLVRHCLFSGMIPAFTQSSRRRFSADLPRELLLQVTTWEERIDVALDGETINRLTKMQEFCKAYEKDSMRSEEFIAFGATIRTMAQFIE